MKLSVGQLQSFAERAADQWDHDTAQALLQLYPQHFASLGVSAADVHRFCNSQRIFAAGYQITEQRAVFKFIVIAVQLGAYFCHDPRFDVGLRHSITNPDIPQDRRMTLFGDFAEAWLGVNWTGDGHRVTGGRLVQIIRSSGQTCTTTDGIRTAFTGFVVQSPTIATTDARAAFLYSCLGQADRIGFHDPYRRCALVGAALLHGLYWLEDPLLANLRRTVELATGPDDLCTRIAAFYAGFP